MENFLNPVTIKCLPSAVVSYVTVSFTTDIFSFLLYESSDKSAKLGYYQLRFLLGKLVVYDASTKKATWSWKISQIFDCHNINSTSVKITIKDFRLVNLCICMLHILKLSIDCGSCMYVYYMKYADIVLVITIIIIIMYSVYDAVVAIHIIFIDYTNAFLL